MLRPSSVSATAAARFLSKSERNCSGTARWVFRTDVEDGTLSRSCRGIRPHVADILKSDDMRSREFRAVHRVFSIRVSNPKSFRKCGAVIVEGAGQTLTGARWSHQHPGAGKPIPIRAIHGLSIRRALATWHRVRLPASGQCLIGVRLDFDIASVAGILACREALWRS